jgi:Na+-driven multidrug efflux pump
VIPGIVLRKFLGLSCAPEEFVTVISAFNAQSRYHKVIVTVPAAVTTGLIPCAAYAYATERIKRVQDFLVHGTWITIAWATFSMIFTVGLPKYTVRLFSSDTDYLYWAEQLMRNSNIMQWCGPVSHLFQSLLHAVEKEARGSILTFAAQLLPLPAFSAILYYTNRHDPARLLYAYAMQHAFGVIIAIPFGIGPLMDIFKRAKLEKSRIQVEDSGPEVYETDPGKIGAKQLADELLDSDTSVHV